MKTRKKYFVGTSGFSYPEWHEKGAFYPSECKEDLFYYSEHFDFVEINNTFYRFPNPKIFNNWKTKIKKGFIFSIKVNRFFTHMKKLQVDAQFIEQWELFWDICQVLKPHLGPLLFQLPSSFKFVSHGVNSTVTKLENLHKILPKKQTVVFECRDTSWQCEEVYELFKKYNWSFCIIHVNNRSGWVGNLQTGFFPTMRKFWNIAKWGSYFRLHGSMGQYFGLYDATVLKTIIDHYKVYYRKFLYTAFDNTSDGKPPSAIQNATQLDKKLRQLALK